MKVQDLLRALNQRAGFELVDKSGTPSQLRLIGRVPLDREGRNMNNWLLVLRELLTRSASAPWKADISKHYFLMAGKVVYAWRIILQGEAIETHLAEVTALVNAAPQTSRTEVAEMPLAGVGPDRNSTVGGKRGAGSVGGVPIGPAAVYSKQMGIG
jgi:hypothetical protein